MKTQLNDNTTERCHKNHSIRLQFENTSTDQALYAALRESSDREDRTPVSRHTKYLLEMALGLRSPDQLMINRILSYLGYPPKALDANAPSSSTSPRTTLRLIPSGAVPVKQDR